MHPSRQKAILSRYSAIDPSLRVLADDGAVASVEMSMDEWLALPGHPKHRPAGGRSVRTQWEFVRNAQSADTLQDFRQVVAADFGDRLYKIAGHERARLWEAGSVPAPRSVFVQLYRVDTREDFNRLFDTFNTSVGEAQYDKVAVAMKNQRLTLQSKRLRYGYILNALNIALRGAPRVHQDKKTTPPIDVERAIEVFRPELKLLDSVDPKPDVFYNGVVAAALIALSLDAKGSLPFFEKLSRKEGSKVDGRMDPVEAILDYVVTLKTRRSAWVSAAQQDLCGRVLRACRTWMTQKADSDQYWFSTTIRSMDITRYIQDMKEKKGIVGDVDL